MHCKLVPPTPKCSLYAKTFKKTQTPIYDALGPFPDEPLMSSIDRVLFLFGGSKVQRFFAKDKCSDECYVKESPTYSVIRKSNCCKCDACSDKCISFRSPSLYCCSNSPRLSIKANSCRQDSGKIGIPLRALKKSFSLCSLACRKFKEKLTVTASCPPTPKWLWTKVENYADGCQVYEVFKNSSAATHPTKFDTSRAAKIIFVILPTGIIMPFETLPCH